MYQQLDVCPCYLQLWVVIHLRQFFYLHILLNQVGQRFCKIFAPGPRRTVEHPGQQSLLLRMYNNQESRIPKIERPTVQRTLVNQVWYAPVLFVKITLYSVFVYGK